MAYTSKNPRFTTLTVTGAWTFGAGSNGYGIVPFGGIIPIASNLTGAYSIPSTGTVDSAGWIYCDGASIPGGNTVSGTTPDLTDERFLVGSTTAGTTGGANSITLTTTELPAHTHTGPSHTHTGPSHTHSFSATTGAGSAHTHTGPSHTHSFSATTGAGSAHNHGVTDPGHGHTTTADNVGAGSSLQFGSGSAASTGSVASNTTGISINNESAHTHSVSGTTGSGGTGTTGSESAHTHSVSGTTGSGGTGNTGASGTGNTGSTGSGSAFNNRPLYVSCQYIMRVK